MHEHPDFTPATSQRRPFRVDAPHRRFAAATEKRTAVVAGTGSYAPERVLSNADLMKLVDTTNEWIVERTGILERRIAGPDETSGTMSIIAARRACEDAGLDPAELDLIIVATVTPDHLFPSTACLVQDAIGATNAAAFDLNAGCTGFIYACHTASGLIQSGVHRKVLVIGAETLSRVTDYTDRGTCILFGDAAGAVVFEAATDGRGILLSHIAADGSGAGLIRQDAGGSRKPASAETVAAGEHFLRMEGRQVFKWATTVFVDLIENAIKACGLTSADIDLIVPHQVNERIVDAALRKLHLPREKCYLNLARYGNTSAASVPLAFDEARKEGLVGPGDTVLLAAFGAGLTSGANVVRL